MAWELDLEGTTYENADAGQYPVEGWYRTTLDDTFEDSNNGKQIFEFKIASGPYEGKVVKQELWNPGMAPDEQKRKSAVDRAKYVAKRTGLYAQDHTGKTLIADWELAIGKEFAIQLRKRTYDKKNASGDVIGQGEVTEIAYDGIYLMSSDAIPNPGRKALGLPLLPEDAAKEVKATPSGKGRRGKAAAGHPDAGSGAPHAAVDTSDM